MDFAEAGHSSVEWSLYRVPLVFSKNRDARRFIPPR
jgi:hypothetical protein